MSTAIQWTDETWNPVVGCEKVSQGCKNCYAKQIHDNRHKAFLSGKNVAPQYAQPFERVQLMPERLLQPLAWRQPRRVFVNSVSDLFHDDVTNEFLAAVFGVMALAHRHTFQILTKRPERQRDFVSRLTLSESIAGLGLYLQRCGIGTDRHYDLINRHLKAHRHVWPLPNVHLGTSVENQKEAYNRIPVIIDTLAALRFLSLEPLLGPIDLTPWLFDKVEGTTMPDYSSPKPPGRGLGWVIVGGESGAKARVCFVECIRDVVSQCVGAGVPVFVKQLGSRPVVKDLTHWHAPAKLLPDSSAYALKLHHKKGGDPDEWLPNLRVREWPAEVAA